MISRTDEKAVFMARRQAYIVILQKQEHGEDTGSSPATAMLQLGCLL